MNFPLFRLDLQIFQIEIAHLPLQLFLHVKCLFETGVAILQPHLSQLIILYLLFILVKLASLPTEHTGYLLCDHHQWLQGLLQGIRHSL